MLLLVESPIRAVYHTLGLSHNGITSTAFGLALTNPVSICFSQSSNKQVAAPIPLTYNLDAVSFPEREKK